MHTCDKPEARENGRLKRWPISADCASRAQLSPFDYMLIELTDKEIHLATPR